MSSNFISRLASGAETFDNRRIELTHSRTAQPNTVIKVGERASCRQDEFSPSPPSCSAKKP